MSTPPEAESTVPLSPAPATFPWPPADAQPVLDALADTWRGATFRPTAFFAELPPRVHLGAVVLYYLVVGVVGAAIQLFWATLLPRAESTLLGELLGTPLDASPLRDFLLSPLYLLASLYLAAGVTHLLVLALVPGQRGFGVTLRVFAFAYSPVLFGLVPYVGPVAAFLWMVVISIIGIREAQRASTARAASAVLIPIAAAAGFILLGYALLRSGAALLAS